MYSFKKIIIFLGFAFLFIYLACFFELTYDEAYYWYISRFFSLSYYDHPPFVPWTIKLSRFIFGRNEFAVRFFAILETLIVLIIFMRMDFGKFLLTLSIPGFLIMGFIHTPDTPQFLFYLIAIIYGSGMLKLKLKSLYHIFILGVIVGFGFLSKYTVVLIFPSVFYLLYVLHEGNLRKILSGLLLFISGFLLISLPVFIWNFENNFASFLFQLHHGFHSNPRPFYSTFFEFIGGQIILLNPVFFGLVIYLSVSFLKDWNLKPSYKKFIFLASFIPLVFFLLLSFRSKIEANWPSFLYSGYILLFDKRNLRVAFISFIAGFLIFFLVLSHAMNPFFFVKNVSDQTNKLRGFKMLVKFLEKNGFNYIATDSPTLTALLRFYSKLEVYCVPPRGHFKFINQNIKKVLWKLRELKFKDKVKGGLEIFIIFKGIPVHRFLIESYGKN